MTDVKDSRRSQRNGESAVMPGGAIPTFPPKTVAELVVYAKAQFQRPS